MRRFYLRHRALHRWLLIALGALAAFQALKGWRGAMNLLSDAVTQPLKRALGALCSLTSVSVAEVWYFVAAAALFFYLAETVRRLLRRKDRGTVLYRAALRLVCIGVTVCAAFSLLWGVNYYTDNFQQQSGVYAQEVALEDLKSLTAEFAQQLSEASPAVARDEQGLFAEKRTQILAESQTLYDHIYATFPTLEMTDYAPKAVVMSEAMSAIGFTGFYFPFSGEANLNVDSPAAFLPSTVAHELAHRRGIASEQECNFIAIVVSTTSDSAAYRYSGWLLGYIHLSNALYEADQDAWKAIRDTLPQEVLRDIVYNNAYWQHYEGLVSDVSDKVYDSMLKGYGEESGIRSYGTVVDMLVAYYK